MDEFERLKNYASAIEIYTWNLYELAGRIRECKDETLKRNLIHGVGLVTDMKQKVELEILKLIQF